VPYAPGGATDSVARIVAQQLSQRLGQTVIVENKPGAGGNIGTKYVADAAPDGYTLLFASTANAINESLHKNLPFSFARDFQPISQLSELPNVLIVNNDIGINTVEELIAAARARPGVLAYGSGGVGTATHLAAELFKYMAKVDIMHVAYKGSAPAMIDLRGGRVQLMFDNIPSALPQIKVNAVRALGVTASSPVPDLPGVPAIAQAGVPGYEAVAWHGVVAPARTPADIVQRLQTEVKAVLQSADTAQKYRDLGVVPVSSTSEEFRRYIAESIDKWGKVIKESGVTVD